MKAFISILMGVYAIALVLFPEIFRNEISHDARFIASAVFMVGAIILGYLND